MKRSRRRTPRVEPANSKATRPTIFVNARVDTYWLGALDTPEATVQRALRYGEAGADCVFVPGASALGALMRLADYVPAPLNVLAMPSRSLAGLADLGARRVSTGSLPYRAALDAARVTGVRTVGTTSRSHSEDGPGLVAERVSARDTSRTHSRNRHPFADTLADEPTGRPESDRLRTPIPAGWRSAPGGSTRIRAGEIPRR
jgi:hypothetical protein